MSSPSHTIPHWCTSHTHSLHNYRKLYIKISLKPLHHCQITWPKNHIVPIMTASHSFSLEKGRMSGNKQRYHRKYCWESHRHVRLYSSAPSSSTPRSLIHLWSVYASCKYTPTQIKDFPEFNHPWLTCEVQTLLKVTNIKVCTKQQKVMSLCSHSDATMSSRTWGRKAIMPMGKESQVSWMRYSM